MGEVGEIGLSSRGLLLESGGILSAATYWGEDVRGKAEAEAEGKAVGGAVVKAGRGEAVVAGASSGAMKETR